MGALALLTGTFVTLPAVLAIGDPNEKSYGDPKELPGWDPMVLQNNTVLVVLNTLLQDIAIPNELIFGR